MGYVNIMAEIDLSDIDDSDLVDELTDRDLNDRLVKSIRETFGNDEKQVIINNPKMSNLADRMKYEYLMKIFDKYNLADIERLLPE